MVFFGLEYAKERYGGSEKNRICTHSNVIFEEEVL